MAHKDLAVALSMVVATSPVSATNPEPIPATVAPTAGEGAKYCLHVEYVTGSRVETVQCWTRQEWVEQEVDLDQEWAKEGVAVIEVEE
jgi:hypothetical protein